MKWVTREKVMLDRVACPWLIRKFIDPKAEFVFVPRGTDPSTIKDGTPFDMKGVELGHHGEECSFDAFIHKYHLDDDLALAEIQKIVLAADTDKSAGFPMAEALDHLAEGFQAIGKDDHDVLKKEFPLYDALYAYYQKQHNQK